MADTSQFTTDELAEMKAKGIDPSTAQIVQPPSKSADSTLLTIGKTLKAHAGGLIGGGAGTLAGVGTLASLGLAPETLGTSLLALPLIAGAGVAGGYGGQKLQQVLTPDDIYAQQQQEAESSAATNPKTALATDIIGSALASGGKPSTDALKGGRALIAKLLGREADSGDVSSLIGTAINAGVNPAINAGVSAATGQPESGEDVGAQVLGGALFGGQSKWANRLIGSHSNLTQDEPKSEVKNNENTVISTETPESTTSEVILSKPQANPDDKEQTTPTTKNVSQVEPVKSSTSSIDSLPKVAEDVGVSEDKKNNLKSMDLNPKDDTDVSTVREPIKDSGFNPPAIPSGFNTKQEILDYRDSYKKAELDFYTSLGLNEKDSKKFFQASDSRSNLDVSDIEDKLTPENKQRLDLFSTGEGKDMYQWDKQYNPENIVNETDKDELSASIVNNLGREDLPTDFGDKRIHAAIALKQLKENGGTWSDIARALDKYTTNNSSSQGDKEEFFKSQGTKIKQFAEQEGVNLEQGDLSSSGSKAENLASKLENLKSGYNPNQLHAFGIIPKIWDDGISLAQGIIRKGGKIIDAVNAFITHLKTNSKASFDEYAVRDHVTKQLAQDNITPKEQSKTPVEQNLPPDKYMGKIGSGFRAVIDKVRDIGTPQAKLLGDSGQMAIDKEDELKGQWKNKVVEAGKDLSTPEREGVFKLMQTEDRTKSFVPLTNLNNKQRIFYRAYRDMINITGQHQLAIGEPITQSSVDKNGKTIYTQRDIKLDPYHVPEMEKSKITQVMRDNKDPKAIEALLKIFDDFNQKELKLTPEESHRRVANWKASLQDGVNNISHQDKFNARRKASGTPLPPEFIETDPVLSAERYADRAAIDASHYEFMEKNHDVLRALGQEKDAWGNKVEGAKDNSLASNTDVKHMLSHWRQEARSPADMDESSFTSMISAAFISGPALEAHKLISNVVKTLSLTTNPLQTARVLSHGLTNILSGYQHAVEGNVIKMTARSTMQMFGGTYTAAERMNAASRLIRKISTLGDITTNVGGALVQAMNEAIIPSKVIRANKGDVTSQLFIRRLDPTYFKGKQYSQQEMQQLSSRSANYIHGTGDVRSLPSWMLNDSEFSGFFSLAHWSIAQTNNFMKDIYEPATRGDIKPLLAGVFGAAIGGYLIKELRQDIQGKKSPIPSLSEISASDKGLEGNKSLLVYNLISAMQYAGFGGLLSQVAKYPFDFAYKNTPQGATFPLDEVVTDTAETLHYVSEAIANDPNVNWVDLAKAVTMHTLSTNFQLGRIAINQGINNGLITGLPAEKKELADKMGQLRRFDMVEGLPYNDIDQGSNPYMNIEQKKYHSEQDLGKAVQELPTLVQNIVSTYGDKPDVMMGKLKALKENQYSTFPSLEQMPLQFMKYIGYLNREEGSEAAQKELQDYMTHKVTNEVKASIMP